MTEKEKDSPIRQKSFDLAIRIVNLYRYLVKEKNEFTLSKQILRSGTSPGANVREAQNGESDADFVHKMSIAQKETAETIYWLDLLYATDYLTLTEYDSLKADSEEVLKMIRSAVLTKKRKMAIKTSATLILLILSGYSFYNLFS